MAKVTLMATEMLAPKHSPQSDAPQNWHGKWKRQP
jgi:hypothetical protein